MLPKITFGILIFSLNSIVLSQQLPIEYEMVFKVNGTFGSEYQVKHLILSQDSTYSYDYYQSTSRSQYLLSNYEVHNHENGNWSINGNKLILTPSDQQPTWQLLKGKRWNLYFLKPDNERGSRFKKKR